jgi:hypothetical protein
MAVTLKDEQSEAVKQHHRNAAGAWINGQQYKEEGAATQPKANSDHGNFTSGKGVDKRNA